MGSFDLSRLHPSLRESFISTAELDAMTEDELTQVFPAWDVVAEDVIRACITHSQDKAS